MVYEHEDSISHEKGVSSAPLHVKFPNPRQLNGENYLECENAGIRIKHKVKFTREEDERIKKNWRRFKRRFNVDQADKILGIFATVKTDDQDIDCIKREKKEVQLLKYQSDFYLRLAYKLDDRTVYSVYQRARKILPDLLTARELSRKQKKRIIKRAKENGLNSKWSQIAKEFNCHSKTVNEIVRNKIDLKEGKKFHKGKWTDEEDEKLIDILKQTLKTDDLSYHYSNIPWTQVSHQMGRAAADCKQRWQCSLHWKLSNPDYKIRLRRNDKIKFIYCLNKLNYQYEHEIDWDFLKEKFSR